MNKQQAFTLIELLVVIAVFAVLVALLAPLRSGLIKPGRSMDDANNLKNMGQAIQQFLHDSKGLMFSREAPETWPKTLHKTYLKDWRAFRSPYDKVSSSRPKRDEDPVPISYGLNHYLFDTDEGKWKAPTSTLIMMAPAVDASAPGKEVIFMANAVSTNNVSVKPTRAQTGLGTHSNRELINVLFADAHVDAIEVKKYSEISTPRGQEQWQP